jgi:restriction system protein
MFGLMTAEKADETIIVTTGHFTQDAKDFAAGKTIRLIDGPQLLAMVKSAQPNPAAAESKNAGAKMTQTDPVCPECGKSMVQRTARRGSKAGHQFWGCSAYPACKGTREA